MKRYALASMLLMTVAFVSSSFSETITLYVTPKSGLNLRDKPGGGKIILMPYNARVSNIKFVPKHEEDMGPELVFLDGRPGHWLSVSYNGKQGFAFDGYLSEVEPAATNPIAGEYILKVAPGGNRPSYLCLYANNTFRYYVNLCHRFGLAYGKYAAGDTGVQLTFERSDCNIFQEAGSKSIELLLSRQDNLLSLSKLVSGNPLPCDLKVGSVYIKK